MPKRVSFLNSFLADVPILYRLKIPGVFRAYKMRTLDKNRFMIKKRTGELKKYQRQSYKRLNKNMI